MIKVQKIFHEKSAQKCYSLQYCHTQSTQPYIVLAWQNMKSKNCFWVFIDFEEQLLNWWYHPMYITQSMIVCELWNSLIIHEIINKRGNFLTSSRWSTDDTIKYVPSGVSSGAHLTDTSIHIRYMLIVRLDTGSVWFQQDMSTVVF